MPKAMALVVLSLRFSQPDHPHNPSPNRQADSKRTRRAFSLLPFSSSTTVHTPGRKAGDSHLGVDSTGDSSPPAAVPAPEVGRSCGIDGRCILPTIIA
jgi:hypothetical protein